MKHDRVSSYSVDDNSVPYICAMRNKGFRVVLPEPNQLLIDLDTEEQFVTFEKQYKRFVEVHECTHVVTVSKGGPPGRHVIVNLPFEIDAAKRITLQGILGSDPMRELLSYFRLQKGDPHPTLFVEKDPELPECTCLTGNGTTPADFCLRHAA
jgi:hypothetical protein